MTYARKAHMSFAITIRRFDGLSVAFVVADSAALAVASLRLRATDASVVSVRAL
jgi:hypothetical protein